MSQKTSEPLTHSLLRNSQVRKRPQSSRGVQNSQHNRIFYRNQSNRYNFNYQSSLSKKSVNQGARPTQNSVVLGQRSQSGQNNHQNKKAMHNIESQNSIKSQKSKVQKLYVCDSAPKTKPKYAASSFVQRTNEYQRDPNRKSMFQSFGQEESKRNEKIRKDLDICLYNLTDKLKELKAKGKQRVIQNHKHRASVMDNSVHRIDPHLVNSYIASVYKEYHIPDPLQEVAQEHQNRTENQVVLGHRKSAIQKSSPHKSNIHGNQHQNRSQNLTLGNVRRNNHLLKRPKDNALRKNRKYLKLTLSQDKIIPQKSLSYVSPKKNKPGFQGVNQKQGLSHSKSKSKSQSLSRKSNSEQKILRLKNDISNWKESQNLYAQRYSYLKSPYEMIYTNQSKHTEVHNSQGQNRQGVNVKVRPFEELNKLNSHRFSQVSKSPNKDSVQKQSFFKNAQSVFIAGDGEVLEEFRYCLLCEKAVLSINIDRHEEKCEGWLHRGKLYTFKQLYEISSHQELTKILRDKIDLIQERVRQKLESIQAANSQKADKEETHGEKATSGIVSSIQQYIKALSGYLRERTSEPASSSKVFTSGQEINNSFSKVQQNYRNLYWALLEDVERLQWMVKMEQNFSNILQKSKRTNSFALSNHEESSYLSSKPRVNKSLNVTHAEEQSIHHHSSAYQQNATHERYRQSQSQAEDHE